MGLVSTCWALSLLAWWQGIYMFKTKWALKLVREEPPNVDLGVEGIGIKRRASNFSKFRLVIF